MNELTVAEQALAEANSVAHDLGPPGLMAMWNDPQVQMAHRLLQTTVPDHVAAVIVLLLYNAGKNAVYQQIGTHIDSDNIQ